MPRTIIELILETNYNKLCHMNYKYGVVIRRKLKNKKVRA